GTEKGDILGCAMSLNDEGWTEIMAQNLPPGEQDSLLGMLLSSRILIDIDGFKLDLGTLGGANTSSNWGEINDFAVLWVFPETAARAPNGEEICGIGTHHVCLPFCAPLAHTQPLPTLGANNGEAMS